MSALFQASKNNQAPVAHRSCLARQRKGLLRSTAIVAVAFVAGMAIASVDAGAQQQLWDGNNDGVGVGDINVVNGGAGTWDGSNAPPFNWVDSSGGFNTTYTDNIDILFGTGGGAVNVINDPSTTDIEFNVDGYVLTGSSIRLVPGTRVINVSNGAATASIANNLVEFGGGAVSLNKTGAGTLVIAGNISGLTGGTLNVSGGTLSVATSAAFNGAVDVSLANGTTLDLQDTVLFANDIGFTGSANVNVDAATSATVSGGLFASGEFVKSGTGTLTLSGGSIHNGTATVDAGTLNITGSINSTTVNIQNNAILQVAGSSLANTATVNISGTANLTLTGDETIGGLNGASGTVTNGGNLLTLNPGGAANFAGIISGGGGLTKTGAGNQTLSGVNDYTGATSVSAGILEISGSGSILTTSSINIAGGTLRLNGAGGNAINDAQLVTNAGTFELTGSDETIGSISGAGAIVLNNNTLTTGNAGNQTVSGAISGIGGSLTKAGTGTLLLSGTNTYSGTTTVTAGTLQVSGNAAIGNNSIVDVQAAGTFQIVAGETIGGLTGAGSVVIDAGQGLITAGLAGTNVFSGGISGNGSYTKAGANTQVFTGANTYLGGTTVSAGTLALNVAGAITGDVTVGGTGVLSLGATGAIGGGGTITTTGSIIDYANGISVANAINVNSDTTQLQVTGVGNTATQSGVISESNGPRDIQKTGAGTLVLSGNNSYQGNTNITVGTLRLTGGDAISNTSGTVNVSAGATLNIAASEAINGLDGAGNVSIDAAATLTTGSNGAGGTLSGVISGDGNLATNGALILTGANLYTGTTSVNSGSLSVTGANGSLVSTVISTSATGSLIVDGSALAAGAAINNAGTFTVDAGDETITSINGAGNVALTNSGTLTLTGNSAIGGVLSGAASNSGITFSGGTSSLDNTGNTISGNIIVSGAALTASVAGSLGTGSASVLVSSGSLDLGTKTHSVQALLVEAAGTLQDGIINVSGFFGTAGTINPNATVNTTSYALTATGGTISALTTSGIFATNNGAITLTAGNTAPAIVSANDGINLNSSGAGDLTVTTGNAVSGASNGIVLANAGVGNVLLTVSANGGDITGTGGDGINIMSTGSGTVMVTGGNALTIITGSNGINSDGIDITADGATTVSVTGAIIGDPGVVFNSLAGANFTLNGVGAVTGLGDEGVLVSTTGGNGTVIINRDGNILGDTDGVEVTTAGGNGAITVTANAARTITGTNEVGVLTRTDAGLNTVTGAGAISGGTFGIDAQATVALGAVTVSGGGATTSTGAGSTVINAHVTAGAGAVIVSRSGLTENTSVAVAASHGINATNAGSGIVDVDSGAVTLNTASTGTAINAVSTGAGNVTVNNAGAVNGGQRGIFASTTGAGTVTIGVDAAIGTMTAPTGSAIRTTAVTGTTTISGGNNVTGNGIGILSTSTGGAIDIQGLGVVTSNLLIGIQAQSAGGAVTIGNITANGNISGGGSDGIKVNSATGTVNIGLAATTSTVTGGIDGIEVDTTTMGNVVILRTGLITGTTGDGINVNSTGATNIQIGEDMPGGTGIGDVTGGNQGIQVRTAGVGTITIDVAGTVTGVTDGILATAVNGNIDIELGGMGSVISAGIAAGEAIDAQTIGTGTITIHGNSGTVVGATDGINALTAGTLIDINTLTSVTGNAGSGIVANTGAGAGNITVTNVLTVLGTGGSGISAGAGIGDISITGSGTTGNIVGNTAFGIVAGVAGAGTIDIQGNGGISGGTTGIRATGQTGDITIGNTTANGNIRGLLSNGITTTTTTGTTSIGQNTTLSTVRGLINGINASSTSGAVIILRSGTITGDAVDGINVTTSGNIQVGTAAGAGTGIGDVIGGTVAGVGNARTATLGDDGIDITNTGAGTITVDLSGAAIGTDAGIVTRAALGATDIELGGTAFVRGTTGFGIDAQSTGVAATITIHGNSGVIIGGTDGINTVTAGAAIDINTLTSVTGNAGNGINATSGGGTVNVGGAAAAQGVGTILGTVGNGILIVSANGNVTVNSNGLTGGIRGTTLDGINVNSGNGLINIGMTNGNGNIRGGIDGVDATSVNGAINVGNNGTITGDAGNGVLAISTSGIISVGSNGVISGQTNGVSASTGPRINVTGNTSITGNTQDGVGAGAGTVFITGNGAISGGNDGIQTTTNAALIIVGNGAISGIAGHGINANALTGTVNIGNTGANGNISGAGAGSDGINVVGGTGVMDIGLAITTTTVTGAQDGIDVDTSSGAIGILRTGLITGTAGDGINALSTLAGNINVAIGTASGATSGITTSTTGAGTSAVTTGGLVSASAGTGIMTTTATGTNTITLGGNVTGTADGINATSTTGNITVTGAGNVTGGTAVGNDGIQTTTTTGITLINVTGAISGDPGIISTSTTGAITINGTGNVTGTAAEGILATSTAGGAVIINRTGVVTGATDGISASTTTGAITITTGGNVSGTSGTGIRVASAAGAATINIGVGHTVTGNTAAIISSAGSLIVNNLGTLSTTNSTASAISVTAGSFAFINVDTAFGAIQSSAGATTSFTNNAGATWSITNATSTLAGIDTIQNDGTLISTGAVNFNGVENFNNTSLNTFTVNGITTIGPNVVFNNTGRISMQDGALGDQLTINGTFAASGTSTLDVDIDLSRNNPGGLQLSDILVLRGGPTSGATTVNFNVLAGTPTLQDTPIIVVDIDPTQANTGSFVDTNGTLPAAGNIIEYKLVQAANGDWVVNSVLNTAAIGSVSGSVQSTLSVIGAVVNRPSSPFVASPIAPDADTCAPGTWGRGTGGRAVVNSKSGAPGAASRDAISTKIGYQGFQGGIDFGCLNIRGKGVDIATGVTGGFNNGTSSTRLPTSLTSSSFESQYIGGYASFQKGAFFADIQGRADYSDFKLNNTTVGLNNVKVKSERFSLTGTAAYSIEVPVGEESYNLVPAIGGSYAQSSTDTVMFADGSTLKLKDQTDILGFAGITVNRVFVTGGEEEDSDLSAYIPFATVTMYNEFGDTPSSVFTDSGGTQRVIDSQNLGLYAEFSAGVNYRKIFTSETSRIREIAASVRGDYKFGQRVQAVGITAQIRFQF